MVEKFPDPDPAYLERKGKVAWMADTQSWCAPQRCLLGACSCVLHAICQGRLSAIALFTWQVTAMRCSCWMYLPLIAYFVLPLGMRIMFCIVHRPSSPVSPLPCRWRESYQRLHPAQYILDKYEGQRYVVLACDVDEVPRRAVVKDLRGPLYPRAADGLYFEMHFLYYNFRRARLHASQVACVEAQQDTNGWFAAALTVVTVAAFVSYHPCDP